MQKDYVRTSVKSRPWDSHPSSVRGATGRQGCALGGHGSWWPDLQGLWLTHLQSGADRSGPAIWFISYEGDLCQPGDLAWREDLQKPDTRTVRWCQHAVPSCADSGANKN